MLMLVDEELDGCCVVEDDASWGSGELVGDASRDGGIGDMVRINFR